MPLTFHIVGDCYVDLFCFLSGALPEPGGDSVLEQPVQTFAGGSTINTATHLMQLVQSFKGACSDSEETPNVFVQTMLNFGDEYGVLLARHAEKHGFKLINCWNAEHHGTAISTPHCVVIVSKDDRSFMTHRGCSENFDAYDLYLQEMIDADSPVHFHIAGFFCTPGFANGSLKKQLEKLRTERERRFLNQPTTVLMVTQFDVSQNWDGSLDEIVPYLSFLIMNELEASKILEARGGVSQTMKGHDKNPLHDWISFFSALSPTTCFVVTTGSDGAVAFRNGALIHTVGPAVPVEVVDPTGAGDAFAAGFLHGI
jgi:sugar/nucleoside kinase (ribokinase family)